MKRLLSLAVTAALALGATTVAASANKADDTIRYSSFFVTRTLDMYFDPTPTTELLSEAVFDTLVTQNFDTGEIVPLLAKSWTRVNPTTLDFDLRDDVVWHDGKKFTADDVVHTLGWLSDPATAIPYKTNWAWIDKVEKLGDYKVRLVAKAPTPFDLMRLAYFTAIYPKHVHGALADKTNFGTKPIGTGPYKAVTVDLNQGFILERNPDYKWASPAKPQNNFKRIEIRGLADTSAHVARYLVGETDVLQLISIDAYNQVMSQKPGSQSFTVWPALWQVYAIPSSGPKLNPVLANPKVRQALLKSVDRSALEKMRSGQSLVWTSFCYKKEPGCGQNVEPLAYDPEGAKKLLAEAGYPNGFDLTITASAPSGTRIVAEAVAGFFSQIGVRAKLDVQQVPALRQKLAERKVEFAVYSEATGVMPDSSSQVLPYFMGQLFEDPKLIELARKSIATMDDAERRKITAELLDAVTSESLIAPLQAPSRFYVFTNEVDMKARKETAYIEGWAFRQLNLKK